MNAPRLFMIGGSLLLLNAAAVLTTGLWRHVVADEPQASGQPAVAASHDADPSTDSSAAASKNNSEGGAAEGVNSAEVVNSAEAVDSAPNYRRVASGHTSEAVDSAPNYRRGASGHTSEAVDSAPNYRRGASGHTNETVETAPNYRRGASGHTREEVNAAEAVDAAAEGLGSSPASGSNNPLDQIPIPESLPPIPSLGDHESLKDDPGFQEFSRLFSKVEESWEMDYPTSVKPRAKLQSAAYFEALDNRLHSAEQLCSVARCIAAEAARQNASGHAKQSEELLQMATQLRDMAAKLLVVEL